MTGMVEQAHLYFRAAVSAAVLNAMAIAGFVLFMALSSVHGWPLRSLLGLGDPVSAPPAASRAINVSRGLGGAQGFGAFSLPTPASHSTTGPGSGGAGPRGGGKLSDDPSSGSGQGASTPGGAPSGPANGTPSPGGPAVGSTDPTPDLPSTTIPPTPPPPSIPQVPQIVGGAVFGLPTTINESVGAAVGSGGPLGSSATTSGVSGMLQGTSSALVGPSSTVGKAQALGATP